MHVLTCLVIALIVNPVCPKCFWDSCAFARTKTDAIICKQLYNKDAAARVRTVFNHQPGPCREVEGPVHGAEDTEIIQSEGIAFITSGVKCSTGACPPGKIFLHDLKQTGEKLQATELTIIGDNFDPAKFFPHGLSHWRMPDGVIRLYVIAHTPQATHSVEVFDFDPEGPALLHKKSINGKGIIRPNGIVAVGPDQFLHTNDGRGQTNVPDLLEIAFKWRDGSVWYYDGRVFHKLVDKKAFANGIAYDIVKRKLFITVYAEETLEVYDLTEDLLTATVVSTTRLYSSCDNLFLDRDGSLFTGCHPIMHMLFHHVSDCSNEENTAPSQILRIQFDDTYKNATITEVYSNDGSMIPASTGGAVYRDKLLIGSVCNNLVRCDIADPSLLGKYSD